MARRENALRNKKHLMELTELPCMFCSAEPCWEAHHIRKGTDGGMGKKPSDCWAIPVCVICHGLIHTKGEITYYAKHGYTVEDVKMVATKLWDNTNAQG